MTTTAALVVVQRYGDVAGGAEAHARTLVQHLAPHVDVEVATTTARDYWTWANEFTPGLTWIDGVPVRRFPVERGRSRDFRLREHRAFSSGHSYADELAFVDAQGPVAPELLEHVRARARDFDHIVFFQYLYHPTVKGMPLAPERAVLVPTAHDEPAIGLSVYRRVFHLPRAIAYNTEEERRMVHRRFGNERVPGDVVGVGVDLPAQRDANRFRTRHGVDGPYFLYVGRIVQGKQIAELAGAFARWQDRRSSPRATLVLMGHSEMAIPAHPAIRELGRTSDEEKFDALAGCVALLQPSLLESLSIIALEAWACGRPVVADVRSAVVWGMTRRANAGLSYRSDAELGEICELLLSDRRLGARLGAMGEAFVARTYTWPSVVEKYLDLFSEIRVRNR
jgi:glycosyltransferase involved in cell wall biosynthesis